MGLIQGRREAPRFEPMARYEQLINQMTGNLQVYNELSKLVFETYLFEDGHNNTLSCGPLEINDFSICFGMEAVGENGRRGVYVKVPKTDRERRTFLPLTEADRKMAEDEYESLVRLAGHWKSPGGNMAYVKPLGFLKEHNAIVTERFYAEDFFKTFRRQDARGKLSSSGHDNHARGILHDLGRSHANFHGHSLEEKTFRADRTLEKIAGYCGQLKRFGVDARFIDGMADRLERLQGYRTQAGFTTTLKGLDIRNVFIDVAGKVFLLDPGKMKTEVREADLARFIVTCRILYWGSMPFFLRLRPDPSYEKSFLDGYYDGRRGNDKILALFMLKELFKHWRMAHVVLKFKKWPGPVKRFLKATYIDPFYEDQLQCESGRIQ